MDVTSISVGSAGQVFAGPVRWGAVVMRSSSSSTIVRRLAADVLEPTVSARTVGTVPGRRQRLPASGESDWGAGPGGAARPPRRRPSGAVTRRPPRAWTSSAASACTSTTMATLDGTDHSAPETGLLTITSRRVVLQGEATHAWDLDAIAQIRHAGQDRTLIPSLPDLHLVLVVVAEGC